MSRTPVRSSGRDALDALLQPLEVGLQHLLAQLVGELGEGVARLVVHELVVAQAVEASGQVLRQRVEPVLALSRRPPRDAPRPSAPRPAPFPGGASSARCSAARTRSAIPRALLLQDLVQPPADVVEHAVEVRPLQLRLRAGRAAAP